MAGHRGAASTHRTVPFSGTGRLQGPQFARLGKLSAGKSSARTTDRVTVYADGSRTSSTVPGAAALHNETFSFDAGQYTALRGVEDALVAPVFQGRDGSAPGDEVMILFADGPTVTLQDVAHLPVKSAV